jgi:hypothetical protein
MKQLRWRVQVPATRVATRALQLVGLRDRILRWRNNRRRARRVARETRGDDRLSRPALHGIDVKLDAIIDREGGFFVEAGAHDGFTQSNTYWLERFRGWHGLLVEPMPELVAEARLSRPAATIVQCALVSADDPRKQLRMHFGDLMSMADGARESDWAELGIVMGWRDPYELDVDASTLSSLLAPCRRCSTKLPHLKWTSCPWMSRALRPWHCAASTLTDTRQDMCSWRSTIAIAIGL